MKKILQYTGAASALTLLSPLVAMAQVGEGANLKLSPPDRGVTDLGMLVNQGIGLAIAIAILFVLVMIIIAGYSWITAGGDKQKVEEARGRITNAIIGIAIIACAWILTSIIAQFFGFSLGGEDLLNFSAVGQPGS